MKLTRTDVLQIARLARLKLSEPEIKQYQHQLSEVLDYIEQLGRVKTNVPTTAQVTGQVNALADDVVSNQPRTEQLLAGSPLRDRDQIKVKAVFDEDGGGA